MKYDQVERKMPQALKDRILSHSRCPEGHEPYDSLTMMLTDPVNLADLLRKLSTDELQTLRIILASFGCLAFTEERLLKEASQKMAGAQVRYGLMGLRRYGIIIAFRKSWGDQLFILPEDAFAEWQLLVFPTRLSPRGEHEIEMAPLEIGDLSECGFINGEERVAVSPRGLAQQLFHFLESCSHQSAFPFTNKGTLYKKQVLKLTEHVRLPRNVISMSGLTYAFTDVYDEPSALMLELALRMGFLSINEAKDGYALDQLSIQSWLQGSYTHQQAELYRIWRQALIPAPVWLEHAIAIMETAVIEQWVELDELFQAIRLRCSAPSTAKHIEDEASLRQTVMMSWITPLLVFAFLEVRRDEQGRLWFRWLITPKKMLEVESERACTSDAHEAAASIYVQPDFELLLPPDVSLFTEWQIAAFAVLQNSDMVRTYRVTKESFGRALDEGMQGGGVLRVLQENTCYELPAGVVITLQQWDEQKDKLSLSAVTLLRCQSADIAEALLRNEKCRPFLGERIGEANFIVAQDVVRHLTKCLETMGFHPNKSLSPKPSSAPAVRVTSATSTIDRPTGLCYSRDTIQLYEIDPQLPQQDDLYPDIHHIPMSWIKELRDYHASTRKDMIRKAIEWKSVLQLRKEGRDCFIIPRMVREERTGWLLEGWEDYQEISWCGNEWSEMKLILPGINDGCVREKEETLGEL